MLYHTKNEPLQVFSQFVLGRGRLAVSDSTFPRGPILTPPRQVVIRPPEPPPEPDDEEEDDGSVEQARIVCVPVQAAPSCAILHLADEEIFRSRVKYQ